MTKREVHSNRPDALALLGRWLRRLLLCLALALALAAVALAITLWPTKHTVYTDADSITEAAETALLRDILWEPPARLPDLINSQANEYEPSISVDGLTLFFVRGKAGANADVYCSRKTHSGWSEPTAVTAINTEFDELGPELSADGQALYFYSDRPGGEGGYDLWVARRGLDANGDFSPAVNLGPAVNSEYNDYGPALTYDGTTLYFASNRPLPEDAQQPDPQAWPGTIREDLFHRTYDLYAADLGFQGAGVARPLTALNTPFNEGAPCVTPFADFVYFASDRPGGEGAFDLYRTRRVQGRHETPTNLGRTINTRANELDPGLTMGGYALYFSSDRPLDDAPPDQPHPYQVYRSNSREVYADVKIQRRSIDWAALWARIGPNLLWALLLLLLLLLFVTLVRDLKGRRLSLLTRCLLASLALHLLLMMVLNVWKVTTALAHEFRRRGPIQVALAGPTAGADLTAQVRGEFTALELPAPAEMTPALRATRLELETDADLENVKIAHQSTVTDAHLETVRLTSDARVMSTLHAPTPPTEVTQRDAYGVLELALPGEEARVARAEAQPPAPATPQPMNAPRPGVHRPRIDQPHTIATTAAVTNTAAPLEPRYSIARGTLAREAQEHLLYAPQPQPVAPAVTQPPALALALPRTRTQAAQTEEANAQPPSVPCPSTESARRFAPAEVEPVETFALVESQFTPIVPPVVQPATSFSSAQPVARDARVAASIGPTASQPTGAAPRIPAPFLSLPELSESSSAQTEVQSRVPERVKPPALRSAAQSLLSHSAYEDALPLEIAPDPGGVEPAQHPSFAQHVTTPREATAVQPNIPLQSSEQTPTIGSIAPSLPPTELALPALEEFASNREDPTLSSPGHATLDGPRRTLDSVFLPAHSASASRVDLAPITEHPTLAASPSLAPKPARAEFSRTPAPRAEVASLPQLNRAFADLILPLPREVVLPTIGTIQGRITDAANGAPIRGATIRLDLSPAEPVEVRSGPDGIYILRPPEVPTFFALSASSPGYLPGARNVATAMVLGKTLELNFELTPQAQTAVALEIEPEVHHLGDNDFGGRINSQFQKRAEGAVYQTTFELSAEQLELAALPSELTVLVKGVQMRHRLLLNGRNLGTALDWSPSDGSFGMFIVEFDPALLRAGTNTFSIHASSRGNDVDDLEFVNLQINLVPTPAPRGGA